MQHVFLALLLAILLGCAPSRYVKPLEKKQSVASLSFGGPMIRFAGAPIPIPFTTLGYAYGIGETITAYGHLHTTSLLFGNAQADVGATVGLFRSGRWGCSASPALQLAGSLRQGGDFRLWPSVDINAFYTKTSGNSYAYAGTGSWFELTQRQAHDVKVSRHWLPALQVGYLLSTGGFQHQFEIKYLGLGIPNLPGVVNYIGISGKGSLGLYYSLCKKF